MLIKLRAEVTKQNHVSIEARSRFTFLPENIYEELQPALVWISAWTAVFVFFCIAAFRIGFTNKTTPSQTETEDREATEKRGSGEQATHTFKHGEKVGIKLSDNGMVLEVFGGGQAIKNGVKVGDRVLKVGDAAYSPDALKSLIQGRSNYTMDFQVGQRDVEAAAEERERPKSLISYRPDIDGLRAIAVIAVTLYHLQETLLPGGFIGVDMFFVISGYVNFGALVRRGGVQMSDALISFYAARITRLAPLALLVICATALMMKVCRPVDENLPRYYASGLASIASGSNVLYNDLHANYFDMGVESLHYNPYTHYWSLGVEEQFFFLFPFLVAITCGQLPNTKKVRERSLRLRLVWGVVIAVSLLTPFLIEVSQYTTFYLLRFRIWEFLAGAVLFDITVGGLWSVALQVAALILIGISLLVTGDDVRHNLAAVLGTMCFVVAGSCKYSILNNILATSPFVFVGSISYAIYLWHWPVFTTMRWSGYLESWPQKICSLILIFVLATGSYYLLERPIQRWRPRGHGTIFAMFLFASTFTAMCLLSVYDSPTSLYVISQCESKANMPNDGNAELQIDDVTYEHGTAMAYAQAVLLAQGVTQSECACQANAQIVHSPPGAKTGNAAKRLKPCFEEFSVEKIFQDSPEDAPVNSSRRVVVLGDSHKQFASAVMQFAFDGQARIFVNNSSPNLVPSCSYQPEECYIARTQVDTCRQHAEAQTADAVNLTKPGDIVVVANRHNKFTPSCMDAHEAFLTDLHSKLSKKGVSLIILGDTFDIARGKPIGDAVSIETLQVGDCVRTHANPTGGKCTVPPDHDSFLQEYETRLHKLAKSLQGAHFFSFWHLFCDPDHGCGPYVPGSCHSIGYSDGNHLNTGGSRYLAPFMCSFLKEERLLKS